LAHGEVEAGGEEGKVSAYSLRGGLDERSLEERRARHENSHAVSESESGEENEVDPSRVAIGRRIMKRHIYGGEGVGERHAGEIPISEQPSELLVGHVCAREGRGEDRVSSAMDRRRGERLLTPGLRDGLLGLS
jgi:hypothetical protein